MKQLLLIGVTIMLSSCISKNEPPEILEGNKSNTLNGTGYVFFTQSQISNQFLEEECVPGKTVLEIGAGFGDLPINALKKGVDEYYVNDISDEHLQILLHKTRSQASDRINKLKIINGRAPEVMRRIDKQFDAIIADKVIHFFTPHEIIEFLKLAKSLLKDNGKLYITSASPYSKRYSAILDDYLTRKNQGECFPGYFTDIMNRLNQSEEIKKNYKNYQVPNTMVLFARDDLVKLLETHGMKVTNSYSFKIPTTENPDWMICKDIESNVVGVIALNTMSNNQLRINVDLASKLIGEQFPEYAHLPVTEVEKQGHDNRTYRLGDQLLIRLPTDESYALKVPKEQELLPKLAKHLSVSIPTPIKMGKPSLDFPYPFSIYKWLPGKSINLLTLTDYQKEQLAIDLANFLKELQAINDVEGPAPGQHNWWRGDHVSVYDEGARTQIASLEDVIDRSKALNLWEKACATRWNKPPVWVHGDVAIGNILMSTRHSEGAQSATVRIHNQGVDRHTSLRSVRDDDTEDCKLSAIIDFGGMAVGDPACDLVIAWTYFEGKAREIFMKEMVLDPETWLRARAWALWKATFELCELKTPDGPEAELQKRIIEDVLNG